MKNNFFLRWISILTAIALIISLFGVQASASIDNFDNAQLESSDLICGNIPAYDEIEAWYNQQPVQNLNPDYVKYLQDAENGDSDLYNGIIPDIHPPVESEFSNQNIARALLPPKYDPRGSSLVTSIKNQDEDGLCSIYSSMSTVESFLIKQGIERNYSENYFNYYFAEDALIAI